MTLDAASAARLALRSFAASMRCTINWSVPCEAMVRNVPPITPAQKVYVVVRFTAKLHMWNLPAAAPNVWIAAHPPGTCAPSDQSAMKVPAI